MKKFLLLCLLLLTGCGKRGSLPTARPFGLPPTGTQTTASLFTFPEGTMILFPGEVPAWELACADRPASPLAEPDWQTCSEAPVGQKYFFPLTTAAMQIRLPRQRPQSAIVDAVWAQRMRPLPVTWTTWFDGAQPGMPVTSTTRWKRIAWQYGQVTFFGPLQTTSVTQIPILDAQPATTSTTPR